MSVTSLTFDRLLDSMPSINETDEALETSDTTKTIFPQCRFHLQSTMVVSQA